MFEISKQKELKQFFDESFSIIIENKANTHQEVSILNPKDFFLNRKLDNDNVSVKLLHGNYEKRLLQVLVNPILSNGLLYQVLNNQSQYDNLIEFSYEDEVFGYDRNTLTPCAYMVSDDLYKENNRILGLPENRQQKVIRVWEFLYEIWVTIYLSDPVFIGFRPK